MDSILLSFIRQFLRVVLTALVPVVLVTFLSIPYSLGGQPGEEHSTTAPVSQQST